MPESTHHVRGTLPVTERGTGDPLVVFIHGWSCRRSDWDATLKALEGQWHCLSLDLPGHGDAGPTTSTMTVTGLADTLVTELAPAKPAQLILVGHSMGGCVALEAASRWDQSPVGVILVDSFGLPYGDMDAETIDSIETPFHDNFVTAMEGLVENTTVPELDEETRAWIKDRMASGNPEWLLPLWHDLLRWSPEAAFRGRRGPILAINGEHISEPAQKRCAPYVEETVLPGTHHFPQFERPEAFREALTDALSRVVKRL